MWSAFVAGAFVNTPVRLVHAPKTLGSKVPGWGAVCHESTRGSANGVTCDSNEKLGTYWTPARSVAVVASMVSRPIVTIAIAWRILLFVAGAKKTAVLADFMLSS